MAVELRIPSAKKCADVVLGHATQAVATMPDVQFAHSGAEVFRADLYLQTNFSTSVVVGLERSDLMKKKQADFIIQFPSMRLRLRRIGDLGDTTLQDAQDWTLYDLYYTL